MFSTPALDPLFRLTITLALAVLFGSAAFEKISARAEWPGVVRNYRVIPERVAGSAAAAILAAELLTAGGLLAASVLLVAPASPLPALAATLLQVGAATAAGLLLLFAWALALNLRRGRTHIDCGCFGSRLGSGIAKWMVWRNLILAIMAGSLLLPRGARALTPFDAIAAAACVATAALLYPVIAVVLRRPPPTFEDNHRTGAIARAAAAG